ncbi:MAG TPA: Hsp20/alpha crystallin family protein [Chitinophagaceae bacterium]
MPEYVKLEAIEAFYKDGVLQIRLPLLEGKVMGTTKHITVK